MSDYARQRQYLGEWATEHVVECDALASGLLYSPFSTVYFGPEKMFRLTGSLPGSAGPSGTYELYYYPQNKPAVHVADVGKGENLFVAPYKITTPINGDSTPFVGTLDLRCEEDDQNRWFIVAIIKLEDPFVKYSGKYYLFTLPPLTSSDSNDISEGNTFKLNDIMQALPGFRHAGFLPVVG